MQKYCKSGYEADDDDDRNASAETNSKNDDNIDSLPLLLSEATAKIFHRSLRNKQTAMNYSKDPHNADSELFLEVTGQQNVSSDFSHWERLPEFSDMDSASDDADWEL